MYIFSIKQSNLEVQREKREEESNFDLLLLHYLLFLLKHVTAS